jgi:hypothetical protein
MRTVRFLSHSAAPSLVQVGPAYRRASETDTHARDTRGLDASPQLRSFVFTVFVIMDAA